MLNGTETWVIVTKELSSESYEFMSYEITKVLSLQSLYEIWITEKNSIFATLNDIDHFMKTILVRHVTESRPA